ncbi:hypothetical protein L6164_020274 [Bauhinia variegata]|uniref:Uncharacterized protein n=1 Tax=Bauhinia variegata TaxID=167791 RepID=A0ACB9MUW4_BAUVA|nr:hypothetical protein L6164_020274 [Bauhinia variegata]
MAALSSSITLVKNPHTQLLSGSSLKPTDKCFLKISSNDVSPGSSFRSKARLTRRKMPLIVRAGGDGEGLNDASIFAGGFVLGGLVVAALGCVYAPQISEALAGTDRKELMRKLPKFIYDEEKQLEKTRKILTEKIAQLNSAIDNVSSQLRANEDPNGYEASSDEIEASYEESFGEV